jgi:hypothetical protein
LRNKIRILVSYYPRRCHLEIRENKSEKWNNARKKKSMNKALLGLLDYQKNYINPSSKKQETMRVIYIF